MSVNTEPAGADTTIGLPKDGEYLFTAADFGFSDPDGNAFLAVQIAALPGAGHLLLNGVAVNAGDFVTVADIGSGLLKYVPDLHGTGATYASFTFQVQDDGGTAGGGIDLDQSANTITFDVSAIKNGDGADNVLIGTSDHETIDGKAGNDTFLGDLGTDVLIGGDGNDTYALGAYLPSSIVEASTTGSGTDTITSTITRSLQLYANVENLTLLGSIAIDGTGNELANRLDGSQNTAANVLTGLGGNDVYILGAGDTVVEAAGGGTDIVGAHATHTLEANVENLTLLGTTAIDGTGNGLANTLDGTANSAANVLTGLAGNDTYFVGAGDTIVEAANEGIDTVESSVAQTLGANVENLVLLGSVVITGTGNGLANRLDGTLNTSANVLTGLAGNDTYVVGAGDTVVEAANGGTDVVESFVTTTLSANVENLVLLGNAASTGTGNSLANRLDGTLNTSANVLTGLGGNDTYIVGAGDTIVEAAGGGTDVVGASISYTLGANVETLVLIGTARTTGTGNALANVLDGSQDKSANVLKGLGGNDTYFVGAGDTVVETASGGKSDLVRSLVNFKLGANVEHLVLIGTTNQNGTGNTLANSIFGNAKNNILDGGAGGDTLNGGAGNDTLIGGTGINFLTGGTGSDLFVFNTPLSKLNVEVLEDFNHTADTMRLENAVMTALGSAGALNPNFFFAGSGPHDPDDHIIYNRASGGLFYDDDGIGAHAAVQLAYLATKPLLAANDFQVI